MHRFGWKSRQRLDGGAAALPGHSKTTPWFRRRSTCLVSATAAGLPAEQTPAVPLPAALDAVELRDPDQRQRELRPFLVPSPNRGIIGNSRYARRLRAQVVEAARDPRRYPPLPSPLPTPNPSPCCSHQQWWNAAG